MEIILLIVSAVAIIVAFACILIASGVIVFNDDKEYCQKCKCRTRHKIIDKKYTFTIFISRTCSDGNKKRVIKSISENNNENEDNTKKFDERLFYDVSYKCKKCGSIFVKQDYEDKC